MSLRVILYYKHVGIKVKITLFINGAHGKLTTEYAI